jgi:hypothetical protein
MDKITLKLEKRRQKFQIKLYGFLSLLIIAVMGTYSYFQFQDYRFIVEGAEKSDVLALTLRSKASDAKSQYDQNKKTFDQLDRVVQQNLEKVFPSQDDYTELTRQIDSFEESLSRSRSPFEVSNLSYQNVVEEDNYFILPFRMSITSSSENFTKFLHMIENSGAIDGDTRLMSVSSIRLSFQGSPGAGSPTDIINFTVQINAYFQK